MSSLTELKSKGRKALHGKWLLAVGVSFIFCFFIILPSFLNSDMYNGRMFYFHPEKTPEFSNIHLFELIYLFLFAGSFNLGLSNFFLTLTRKKSDAFASFFSFLKSGDRFVQSIGYFVLYVVYIFLWSLLLIIPGIIKSYSYALAPYLLIDNPNLSPNDAITKSRQLMNGKKWSLFLLHLSFIGWFLLAILTFGIGMLWLRSYVDATVAQFYREVRAEEDDDDIEYS